MLPFEKSDLYYPGLGNNEIVPVPLPGRIFIQKFNVVGSVGSFNAFLYNRCFGNPFAGISTITTANGKAKLTFRYGHRFLIGDRLVVAGTTVSGYHTTHVITGMLSDLEVVTDQDYSADATGGTATLQIPVATSFSIAGKMGFRTEVDHVFKVGDTVTIASHSVAGYNASHIVTAVIDSKTVVTATAYTADGTGGTVVLAVLTNNQALFEVVPSTAASSNIARYEKDYGKPLFNQDVRRQADNSGIPRFAYFKTSAAGDYYLSLAGQLAQ